MKNLFPSYNLLLSLINVLVVIIPVLMAIAFMTILERKQLAAHQRRVGPDTVGHKNLNLLFIYYLKKHYHNKPKNCDESAIIKLSRIRKAPVKFFIFYFIFTLTNLSYLIRT